MLRVLPDEKDDVQHRLEELKEGWEVILAVQLIEPIFKGAEVLHVVVRLEAGAEHVFAKSRKGSAVS